MKTIIKIYSNSLKFIASSLLIFLFLNVILQVFSRAFMDSVPSWTEEVGSLFLIWLVASAAGILFLERKPIGIDFIFDRCSKRIQKLIIGLNVTLSIGFLIMLGTGSYLLAEKSVNVRSPALNLSFSYTFSSLAIASIIIILSILLRLLSSYYSNSNVDEMGNVK